MNRTLTILAVIVVVGCARHPQAPVSVSDAQRVEPSRDVLSEFLVAAADVQVFGYGPRERGEGSVGYFMLYVNKPEDTQIRVPWNTQIPEGQMVWVIQSMSHEGFFGIPEEPTPDRKNWRLGIYGPPGRVERYCTKKEFDRIVEGIDKVLPNEFKVKGR